MARRATDSEWLGTESPVCRAIDQYSRDCLRTYEIDKRRVVADANIERTAIEGGYARRQLFELVQNGADELIGGGGRIEVVLTADAMYCANEGRPVSEAGVGALLGSHSSPKTGLEIGRFGLGFKSVLGITTRPAVYSRSGSFRFDTDYNLERVRRVVGDAGRVATLRIAVPLDPRDAAGEDPVLAHLMEWATTVIKMPLDPARDTSWLSEHIRLFPKPFLLFSEHVSELVLDDQTQDRKRVIGLERVEEHRWILREPGARQPEVEWRVFGTTHRPSPGVKDDGGTMADRDEVPVQWAISASELRSEGEFWAFFPTLELTTMRGVLNAPWKLNEDRTRVIEGPFNRELVDQIVSLLVEGLPSLASGGDPGVVLDLLPGREKEKRGWADLHLVREVYPALSRAPSLPDLDGELQLPSEIQLHPDGVSPEAIAMWAEHPRAPRNWIHPSAYRSDTRRARISRIVEPVGNVPSAVIPWLEALVRSPRDYEGSAAAVRVAAELIRSPIRDEVLRARIVATHQGKLVPPARGAVFLPAVDEVDVDVPIVAAEVLSEPGALDAFGELQIAVVSAETVLDGLIDRAVGSELVKDWTRIWAIASQLPVDRVRELVIGQHGLDADDVRVKTVGGGWERLSSVLLPGDLLSVGDFVAGHRVALVDTDYHQRDLPVLRALGATDRPKPGGGSVDEAWVEEYRKRLATDAVKSAQEHGARSRESQYKLDRVTEFAGPSGVLDALEPDAAARYAYELLTNTPELPTWTLVREDGKGTPLSVEHPLIWRVRGLGRTPTRTGAIEPIGDCISPLLKEFEDLLPVAELPRGAALALKLPDTVAELDEHRAARALQTVDNIERGELLGPAYARLATVLADPPEKIRAIVRDEIVLAPRGAVCAAPTIDDAKVLRGTGTPFVRVRDEELANLLVSRWGLASVADAVSSRLVITEDGPGELAVDLFPLLRHVVGPDVEVITIVPCRDIARELYTEAGSVSEPKDFELRDGVAYRSLRLDDAAVVSRLCERLGVPLDDAEIGRVLKNAHDATVEALMSKVRGLSTDEEKLLELIGAEAIRSRIPRELVEAVEESDGELDDFGTASLALNVFGIETLKHFRDVLVERGLQVPGSWLGGQPAARFVVADLGMDRKYAGFSDAGPPPKEVTVDGPLPLPKLHDFQRHSADAIRAAVRGEGGQRGLLSLPTGAGKTRVAVQALTEAIAGDELSSPVLWIAQTHELCEQAVQSWIEVWRSAGARRTLRVSRLWGTHPQAASREDEGPQVVVATINKLVECVDDADYEWLREGVSCVVVDEAHTSISTMHSKVLRWLEMDRGKERVPLIGLSATPFRGTSEVETEQLVNRYGRRRFDKGAFEEEASIPLLQRRGILARVEHRILDGSEEVPLTASERSDIEKTRLLPASVLNKIGGDLDRTNRLVDSVMGLDPEWPVLLFAASVAHARTIAALLERRGRTAAAISSNDTPTPVRRHLIKEFREGRLSTLTNFGVLKQGFDAPSIRALYIARPTYSPNEYQQMIGRGLRGPKNGGKDECLVVDVADNLVVHGAQLAFREFEYLWTA